MVSLAAGDARPSDAELIGAVALQDRAAFAGLFGRYAPRIKRLMMRRGAAEADAEEVVQEVMVAIWCNAASFDAGKAGAATWIFAIARNRRIDMVRRARRMATDPADPLLQDERDGLASVSSAERSARLQAALAGLAAAEQREALELAYFGGLSQAAIAARTGVPLGTVKSRIRLAFGHLRRALAADLAGEADD